MADLPTGWEARGKPPTLFRRFEFQRFSETRAFLDALADLAKEAGMHPQNINFGSTYVNVTLDATAGDEPGREELIFAGRINALQSAAGG